MKIIFCIFILLSPILLSAQINQQYNSPRVGDELIKQQVDYKDPGRDGQNVIWDFGQLKSINDEYILSYSMAPLADGSILMIGKDSVKVDESHSIVIGTEHYTMYYYLCDQNRLLLLGHENPTTYLRYTQPQLVISYPTDFGEVYSQDYQGRGMYSGRVAFETKGEVSIKADAFGMMVLPSGDTLSHVMRIKTRQLVQDETENGKTNLVENYKWYSKGYRYPIFETVRNMDLAQEKEVFSTAFFFPPQDHFYLDDDPANLAILDSLWNVGQPIGDIDTENQTPKEKLVYNFYPNPVESQLTVEYVLEKAGNVAIALYSMEGRLVKSLNRSNQPKGINREILDCSALSKGTYILTIQTNSSLNTSDKILKK